MSYQTIRRDHHRHRPKEYFEVVRKFCSTSVARVHGNEDAAVLLQLHFFIIEQHLRFGFVVNFWNGGFQFCLPDVEEHLRDYGKHFNVDTVEFIEA